ncbi:MAG TPA: hypothetical protein VNH17_15360 [Streptosporangiaceae bacterium]|nr:hypothetical protein [Streptosporangiaceae bacterium]
MTVDIARMDHNAVAVLGNTGDALARLGEWVQAASHANRLVAPLVGTAFIPDAYKPKIDPRATAEEKQAARETAIANATAAVLQGITLGLDPMTALQQIYIVKGRPGMYSRIKVALLVAHGHEVWTEDISDTRAVVCGRRKGSDVVERVTVTMDQARKAGWSSNEAYAKTPQDMLYARAAARVCDRVAPDVLMGIASVEEIQDEIQATAEVGNGHRTVRPRQKPAPIEATTVEEPPLEEAPAKRPPISPHSGLTSDAYDTVQDEIDERAEAEARAAERAERPAGNITAAQQKMLHALLRDTDRGDRDVALVYISGVLEREVQSTKELSKADAGKVIDALNAEGPADPTLPDLDEDGPA